MPKLKQYLSESEITDDLKGAYTKSGDRYKLNDLSDDHSLIVAQTEVNSKAEARQTQLEAQTAELARLNGEIGRLSGDLSRAQAGAVPAGFVAVRKEDAELAEKVKALGVPVEEIPTLKTENDAFKQEKAAAEANTLRRGAAESLGYNADAFTPLAADLDVIKEGEKYFVNVKNGETVEKKELTKEFVESSDKFKPFLPSLVTKPKTGNTPDPRPAGGATDAEAAKAALASQGQMIGNRF